MSFRRAGFWTCLLTVALPGLLALAVDPTNWTADVIYVSPTGGNVPPYASWEDAANSIQDAVDASRAGDLVLVSNGVYDVDAGAAVTAGVHVAAWHGPAVTVIDGGYPARSNRCVFIDHPDAVLEGFTIRNGYATGESPKGGGVYLDDGTVSNCVICHNGAQICDPTNDWDYGEGGGVYVTNDGVVAGCVIWGNVAASAGGGVYAAGGTVERCTVKENSSWWESPLLGGGVCARGSAVIRGCNIHSNRATNGGGVWMSGGLVYSCTISSNAAHGYNADWDIHSGQGGGVRMYGGRLIDCTILGNRTAEWGAGVCAEEATVDGCVIVRNYGGWPCVLEGGGVKAVWLATVRNSVISNNQATAGGGVSLGYDCWMENCVVCSNNASEGGGVLASGSGGLIVYSTIVSNTADQGGGVLRTPEGGLAMVNSIIYYNTAGTGANWLEWGSSEMVCSNCCTDPVPAVNNCIAGPPKFAKTIYGTYRLDPESPCIDTGTAVGWVNVDIDGMPRPLDGNRILGAISDIGAHEYANPGLDTDRDGRSDWDEAVCGSNPIDADSRFEVKIISLGAGTYLVGYWEGGRYRAYTVQGTEALCDDKWSSVPGCKDIRGTGGEMRKQIKTGGRLGCYRVVARWGRYDWDNPRYAGDDPYDLP